MQWGGGGEVCGPSAERLRGQPGEEGGEHDPLPQDGQVSPPAATQTGLKPVLSVTFNIQVQNPVPIVLDVLAVQEFCTLSTLKPSRKSMTTDCDCIHQPELKN